MSMTHDDLTRAARTMVDVEPPQDLEARIKRRLDREAQARPTITRWPIAAGLATALATVIIVVALRSPEVPESRSLPAVALAKAGQEVPRSRSAEVVVSPVTARGPRDRGTSGPRTPGTSMEAELAWLERSIPALKAIAPIQPEAMLITPLTMTPLVTTPVTGDGDAGRQH